MLGRDQVAAALEAASRDIGLRLLRVTATGIHVMPDVNVQRPVQRRTGNMYGTREWKDSS